MAFSEPGRYRLCLQVSSQGVCTTDVLHVDAGRDLSIEEAPEVWFQETINVGDDGATAKAMIVGGNQRSYRVAVYYGFLGSDQWNGLLDLGERSAGSFRKAITGLRANQDYHYRFLIDEKHWTPSLVFRTEEPPDKRMSLLYQESELRFHVPKDESLDDVWMAVDFDDSKWEKTVNYVQDKTPGLGVTYVSNIASQSGTSAYGRMSFHLDDVASLRDASISVRFNDAVVVYVNGQEVARSELAPEKIHWQSSSLQNIPSRRGHGYWTLGFDEFQHLLVSGSNVLAVHSMHYADNSDGFKLTGRVLITVPSPSEHLLAEPLRGYFDWASDVGLSLTEAHLGAGPDRDGRSNLM